MVSWVGDPRLAGYNPTTKRLDPNLYHFTTNGTTVDVNAITRSQYTPADSVSAPGAVYDWPHPDRTWATATVTFVADDFTEAGLNAVLSVRAYIAPASDFAPGVTPTPSQIYNAPHVFITESDSGTMWTSGPAPASRTVTVRCYDTRGVVPGTKFWIALMPIYCKSLSIWRDQTPSKTNTKLFTGVTANTFGRAMSYWTNRKPTKPVITSPASGVRVDSAAPIVSLTFTTPNADAVVPDDSKRYNADLGYVEIQYAPVPTADQPSPTWKALPYYDSVKNEDTAAAFRLNGGAGPATISILENRGLPILCGSRSPLANHGALPSGEWQVRVRIGDFGHPYPSEIGSMNLASDLSEWSDPVRIVVPARVPAPVPIAPDDNNAVAESRDVVLSWDYRNTADTLNTQARRWVQIREVGDPDWSTIFAGDGTDPSVTLPPVLDNPDPVADAEYFPLGDFEIAGSETGWYTNINDYGSMGPTTRVTSVTAPSPTHMLATSYTSYSGGGDPPTLVSVVEPVAGHDIFDFSTWVRPSSDALAITVQAVWANTSDLTDPGLVTYPDPDTGEAGRSYVQFRPDLETPPGPAVWPGAGQYLVSLADLRKPPGAEALVLLIAEIGHDTSTTTTGVRIDDVSLVGSTLTATDDFTLEATTNYEWRVRTEDASGAQSDYSAPAPFWVVEAPESGAVITPPSETTDGATLGCGTYDVFVYRRGGSIRVGQITGISSLSWGRKRDDMSDAKVVISGWDFDCGNLLSKLQTWAYEIVIFRHDGYTTDRVWEGPITLLTYEKDTVTIQAKDVVGYLYRRIIRQEMNDSRNGATVVSRATQIVQNALAPDDPNVLAYLNPLVRSDDPMQYRSTPAYSRTAFEEIDDMAANAGLDYCAVGRSILIWATKHRIGTLPELTDEHLGNAPIVSEYGMSMANRYVVSDGNGVWGEANRLDVSGNDPTYGLVEMLSSTWASDSTEDTGTYTQEGLETVRKSFAEFAERSISDRYGPPVIVRIPDNTSLNPNTPLSIQHLVPGVAIPLRSTGTLRTVAATQKLDSVAVAVEAGKETISITLSPFSRDDDATVEGEEG